MTLLDSESKTNRGDCSLAGIFNLTTKQLEEMKAYEIREKIGAGK
jgi:hypothetical protein